jgi:PAS domain S-box-containing protein
MAGDLIAQLAQNIVEQANDSIVFADPQGTIRLWNAGAEAMWGYTATEAVGQRLDLIVPERFRADHWAGYESAMVWSLDRPRTGINSCPHAPCVKMV